MYTVTDWALGLHKLWAQVAIVSIEFLVGLFFALALAISTNSVPHLTEYLRDSRSHGTVVALLNVFASWVVITAGFTALQALLFQHGAVSVSGGHSSDYLGVALRYYLWNLVDTIPGLNVPHTLNVSLRHSFTDHLSGSLALLYKIIVIFTFLKAVTLLVIDALHRRGLVVYESPADM